MEFSHEDEQEPDEFEEGQEPSDVEDELEEQGDEELVIVPLEPEEENEVEASLDEILRERIGGEEANEEDEEQAPLPPGAEEEVAPRSANEFVCQSCFLVKHRSQLADTTRLRCIDCVNNGR